MIRTGVEQRAVLSLAQVVARSGLAEGEVVALLGDRMVSGRITACQARQLSAIHDARLRWRARWGRTSRAEA